MADYRCPSCEQTNKIVTYHSVPGADEVTAVTTEDLKDPEFMLKHIFCDICACGKGVDNPEGTDGIFPIDAGK